MPFDLSAYEPVENRIRMYWRDHPLGRITTELLAHGDGEYVVMASVYRGDELRDQPPCATGLAHEAVASLPANMKTSALEVCETSAIGRALANLGYAPKGARPSREEMAAASPPAKRSGESAQADQDGGGADVHGEGTDALPPPNNGDWTEQLEIRYGSLGAAFVAAKARYPDAKSLVGLSQEQVEALLAQEVSA